LLCLAQLADDLVSSMPFTLHRESPSGTFLPPCSHSHWLRFSRAGQVTAPITITGNVQSSASILASEISTSGVGGAFTVGGTFSGLLRVPGNVSGPITITGSSGLAGQIILNSSNSGSTWTGSLSVGGTAITDKPYYAATDLGGGAVGLAPFHYHPDESTPVDDSILNAEPTNPVRVVWYGPLSAESANKPAKVYSRKNYGSGSWSDVTANYTISVDSSNTRHLLVSATSGWTGGREYKVAPNVTGSDRLLCANLTTGTATRVFDDTSDPYSFYINPLIGGRSSGGGSLQDQLDAWDAEPYDADDDGLTDSDDRAYIIYLYNFLNP